VSAGVLRWLWVCLCLFAARCALAQGCASCYTTTAAGGTQTIHALRTGILILLIPPVLIFSALVLLLRRWRSRETAR
jgi:uncharacterized membrane protein YhaH (DUF805 family)